jgi:hypothetical protein
MNSNSSTAEGKRKTEMEKKKPQTRLFQAEASGSVQEALYAWFDEHGRNRAAWLSFSEAYKRSEILPELNKPETGGLAYRNASADLVSEMGSLGWSSFCQQVGDDDVKIVPSLTEEFLLRYAVETYRKIFDEMGSGEIVEIALPKKDEKGNVVRDADGYVTIEKRNVLKRDHVTRKFREQVCASNNLSAAEFDKLVGVAP